MTDTQRKDRNRGREREWDTETVITLSCIAAWTEDREQIMNERGAIRREEKERTRSADYEPHPAKDRRGCDTLTSTIR